VHNEASAVVAQMTLPEKARMCSGRNFWYLEDLPRLNIESVMLTDGPHGLRKQATSADHLGLGKSVAATCFPTASALASSWDIELLETIGGALGEKAAIEDVALLLGPGLNIKRHPLCGRNFEYFSEDPLLSGDLAGALVRGVQSQGVGACLKHFAVNNQEQGRMVTDVIVDQRTLREIYLKGFERAVKASDPWSVMCAYNRVNGEYCSDSAFLLNDVLRDEWGFNGLVVTDWGAMNDRVTGIASGLDLEMPGSGGVNDALIEDAVAAGTLAEDAVDVAVTRVISLALHGAALKRAKANEDVVLNEAVHHKLARRAAAESAVLLKNEGVLPLAKDTTGIALIGEFACHPRFQGAGSSQVRATKVDSLFDAMAAALGYECAYARGYDRKAGASKTDDVLDEALLDEAESVAASASSVVLMIGLPAAYESEGFDRAHMQLPQQHDELVRRVCTANPNTVVVLSNGAPVGLPWVAQAPAVLECYLAGQAGGTALADLLLGEANPSGRLAETFPLRQEDVPADLNFPGAPRQVQYREALYVGYRYFDSAQAEVRFPFGHGLGYTTFEYSDLQLPQRIVTADDTISVTLTLTNTGSVAGKEVVQLYASDRTASVYRPEQELRAYQKVALAPGEAQAVTLQFPARELAFYDVQANDWRLESGVTSLRIGASSRDIRLAAEIEIQAETQVLNDVPAVTTGYAQPGRPFRADDSGFAALLGHEIPEPEPVRPFHFNSTLGEVRVTRCHCAPCCCSAGASCRATGWTRCSH